MSYLDTAAAFYDSVAREPGLGACCSQPNDLALPDLVVPPQLAAMSYGCGTTVHPAELADAPTVLYVGVGGGLEALRFAYFSRRAGAVVAVDPVASMRAAACANLRAAAALNPWFDTAFVEVLAGDAFALPVPDASVDLVAQNCLFNIFEPADLRRALAEAVRVLRPAGRLIMSDPIAARAIPEHLRRDERLRAMCLSGALTYEEYLAELASAGFRHIEVRARRPYRTLASAEYGLDADLELEALDTVARKPATRDQPLAVYSGRRAVYIGADAAAVIGDIELVRHAPLAVSDELAARLARERAHDVLVTAPTWRYDPHGTP